MRSLECEQIESDLYPPDSEFIAALRDVLEGFLKQPAKRTLGEVSHSSKRELDEVMEWRQSRCQQKELPTIVQDGRIEV